jgi:hypothetical protein
MMVLDRIIDVLRNGRAKKLALLMAAVLLAAAGLTASPRTWLSAATTPAEKLTASASTQNSSVTQQQEQGVIRLLTSGFTEAEISGMSGQYRLVATRASQNEEVVLQLKTGSGELVQEITMPQEKLDWTTLIELAAGSYTLTVVNHPDWVCQITIQ